MSATDAVETRCVLFEIGGQSYALPIADVHEVTETGRTAGIPTLPRGFAEVMNHQGDALALIARDAVFEVHAALPPARHVLVLGTSRAARLGLPVDRVVGLVDLELAPPRGRELLVERRPLRGRVVAVLDARRLLERATAVIGDGCFATGAGEASVRQESMGGMS